MKRFMLLMTLVAASLLSATSQAVAQSDFDAVFGRSGTPTRGLIIEISPDEVVIEVNRVRRSFDVNEIRKVTFADDPGELSRARDAIRGNQVETGLELLEQIDPDDIQRAVVRQDLAFFLAYAKSQMALTRGGDKKEAVSAMGAFIQANRTSFHFYEACEVYGHLQVSLGEYEKAVQAYSALARAPFPEYQTRALVLEARTLHIQGNFADAAVKYEEVINNPVDSVEAQREKQLAIVGKAACMAETGEAEAALSVLENIIENNNPQDAELFARTYNALGACYRAKGQSKDALLAYLHVDILFYADSDAHAESLFYLSQLWGEVRKSGRANQARDLLRNRYLGSPWSRRSTGSG